MNSAKYLFVHLFAIFPSKKAVVLQIYNGLVTLLKQYIFWKYSRKCLKFEKVIFVLFIFYIILGLLELQVPESHIFPTKRRERTEIMQWPRNDELSDQSKMGVSVAESGAFIAANAKHIQVRSIASVLGMSPGLLDKTNTDSDTDLVLGKKKI